MADPVLKSDIQLKAVDLRIDDVSASYGDHRVLNHINLDVRPGEFFALLGPSGCGKTTLLRTIAGFAQAEAGRVVVGGNDISRLPPWKRDVGMVFQSYALWPHLTVARNVAFGLEERRLPRADIARRVATALDFVGLGQLGDRRPSELSGGQQQRVALARTIAIEPKILLLDEPLSNLDAKLRIQVRRELRNLQQRLGLTTILVTHDQEEANTICDRVAVMSAGEVQQIGTPAELYEQPANLFVAQFLGTANVFEGRVVSAETGRVFESSSGLRFPIATEVDVPDGARLVFRPQDATIVTNDTAAAGAGVISGRIVYREFLGSTLRYGIQADGADLYVDAPFKTGVQPLAPGDLVGVSIAENSVKWLPA